MSSPDGSSKKEGGQATSVTERVWESQTGWIVRAREQGQLIIDFEGNTAGPLEARTTVELSPEELRTAIAGRRPVELRFENGDPRLPVVVGIAPVISLNDLLQGLTRSHEDEEEASGEPASEEEGVRIIQARDELVIQCGKASITLRRNGKVIIKGTYVETHAEGVNRIKGGSVQVN
ncbi:DUF6484 domain-containing protein [Pyxidicoccus sp. MSG2]|uniref:DUF6484 domain-containing protein n=1 Tax=Pyxidicoccus sp. MSG2 TaxID=2996790 RepID=UPI002271C8EB|nr:DUF6484 domain-containing protein [Pyxidicoccus sp. MSG2]MCY1017407.1 DUF6484 domain-containing protein [Pyxidicoccus sp. MSG2]